MNGAAASKRHHHSTVDFPRLHIAEHLVDVLELHLVGMGVDFAFGGEGASVGYVSTCQITGLRD